MKTQKIFRIFILLLAASMLFGRPSIAMAEEPGAGETDMVASSNEQTCRVRFDFNYPGGRTWDEEIRRGNYAPEYFTPEREGYTFGGWSTTPHGRELYDMHQPVWEDLWLYAIWYQDCQVSFVSEFGTVPGPQTLKWGSKVQEPDLPEVSGYIFDGWFSSPDYRTQWDFEKDTVPEGSLTLYAKWGKCVNIVVDPHNGQGANFIEGVTGHTVDRSLLPHFSNGDFSIEGYYTDSQYQHYFDIDKDLITGEMELHIKWANQCSVTFAANREGFEDRTMTLFEGGLIRQDTLEQALTGLQTADGKYKAYHWYKDKACTEIWEPETDCAYDGLVLYADWGYTYDSFIPLIDGKFFYCREGDMSLDVSPWGKDDYWIANSIGGVMLTAGKIEKIRNVYTIYADSINGAASYTMDGDTAVSLSYTGYNFTNGIYYPSWQVDCEPNGGHMWGIAMRISVFDGETATEPSVENQPTRENYQFNGWYTEPDGGSKFDFSQPIHGNVTIYAHWYRDFSVTLDANWSGGKDRTVKVEEGKYVPEDIVPGSRTGYRFSGWYKDAGGWEKFTGPITEDITLYARWDPNEYTISFDVQGHGETPAPIKGYYDSMLHGAPQPGDWPYTFGGWYRDKACTKAWNLEADRVKGEMTLYAKWLSPYRVTFVTEGPGTAPESILVARNDMISAPETETIEYMTFDGWYTDKNYTDPWLFYRYAVMSDITLYGRWRDDCMVTDVTDHGEAPQTEIVPCGQKIKCPDDPWADGYVFAGWYKDSSFTTPWDFSADTVPEDYLYLYARWEKEVWIMIDPHNGGDALVIPGVTGELVNLSGLPPIRNGEKVIAGWYRDSAFKKPFDLTRDRVVEGLELHIAWEAMSKTTFPDGSGRNTETEEAVKYAIIEGADSIWQQGSGKHQSFRSDIPYEKLAAVRVDGIQIDSAYYTSEADPAVIHLEPVFLDLLSSGSHELTIVSTDGEASCRFAVTAARNAEEPQESGGAATGDGSRFFVWCMLAVCSGTALAGTAVAEYKRRRKEMH